MWTNMDIDYTKTFNDMKTLIDQLECFGVNAFINNIRAENVNQPKTSKLIPSIFISVDTLRDFMFNDLSNNESFQQPAKMVLYFNKNLGSENPSNTDEIDPEIMPLCKAFWELKVVTRYSCAGHTQSDGKISSYSYVSMELSSLTKVQCTNEYMLIEFLSII